MIIKERDVIKSADIFLLDNGEPVKKDITQLLGTKRVILFGLPGAYTSVCSKKHLPSFINNYSKLKSLEVDEIICVSVNDPYVMDAWGKSQDIDNKIIMLADPYLNFTKLIGAEVDKTEKGLGIRSNRYSMLIDNLIVLKIYEEKDTKSCDVSSGDYYLDNW
jgi:peroxiredoxin